MATRTFRIAAVVVLLFLAACAGETGQKAEEPAAPVAVQVITTALEAVPTEVTATGSAEAIRQVAPGTKILGRIDEVAVREGDRVTKGQLLARLESRDLEAAMRQAEAAINMAQAELDNATAQEARMRGLQSRGSATAKNLEDATAALAVRRAGLAQAQANLEAAKVMLGYARVTSPVAGWVVERRVEAGDMAAPGAPMFVVEDLSRIKVTVQVAESDVSRLETGGGAVVTIMGHRTEGTVARIVPAGDSSSRTFEVQVILDNPDGALKSGMFARVAFAVGEHETLRVPRSAVVRRGQLDGVFVVGEDGLAHLRWVRLGPVAEDSQGAVSAPDEKGAVGASDENAAVGASSENAAVGAPVEKIEVISGLNPGEQIVLDPPAELLDGGAVEVRS